MIKKALLTFIIIAISSLLYADITLPYKNTEVFVKDFKNRKIVHMFSLSEASNVEFHIKHSKAYEKINAYSFMLYDENGEKGHQFLRVFPDTNKDYIVNLPLKAGLYSLMMFSSNYLETPFELSINTTLGNYEQEPNDTFADATPMTANTFYTGYIQRKDGTKLYDYYKFTIENDSKIEVTFKANERCNEKSGYLGYKFALFDGDLSKGEYSKQNYPLFEETNNKQEITKTIDAKAGDYYFRVKLKSSSSFNKCDWNRSYSVKYSVFDK